MSLPTALVVDDNKVMRQIATALLQRFGFFIAAASNGREAVAAMSDTKYDLILMDVEMPIMDGLQASLAIRQTEQFEHTLIIGVTGGGNREECLAAGMDDYIEKPLTMSVLEQMLKQWGWTQISTHVELKQIRESLRRRRNELASQKKIIQQQHEAIKERLRKLDQKPSARESEELREWEESLNKREWALKTREQFLARREESASEIEGDSHSLG